MKITGVHVWRTGSNSPEQTMRVGEGVGKVVRAGDVIALYGELGAGKTQFVRGIARGMQVDGREVASPTFVMVHEYAALGKPVLVHIDAYRLKSLEDLESIGWDVSGSSEMRQGAVVAIEWADRLAGSVGDDLLEIWLEHAGDDRRQIAIAARGKWVARMALLRQTLDAAATGETTS